MDINELYDAIKPHDMDYMEKDYKDLRIEALTKRVEELEDSLKSANHTITYLISNFNTVKENE